jgi:murein DD-endopeptidase MepM/ murein hydrolase activator NlpD
MIVRHRYMTAVLRALTAALILAVGDLVGAAQSEQAPDLIAWTPALLESGSPCLFTMKTQAGTTAVTGKWQGRDVTFFRGGDGLSWYALVGIDVEVTQGTYPLTVDVVATGEKHQTLHRDVSVQAAKYAKVTLHVPDKFVQPDAEALKQIEADKVVKEKAFANTEPKPEWSESFLPPLKMAPKSDSFGTRRVFNGTLASVHRGLDYRAAPGTRVASINSGRVVLARALYYEGNCVVIDHGMGLMSVYMHLSKFMAAEGDEVTRGEVIALSGGSGRATGPHLHLGVRWQGAYLDPAKLFALALPKPH